LLRSEFSIKAKKKIIYSRRDALISRIQRRGSYAANELSQSFVTRAKLDISDASRSALQSFIALDISRILRGIFRGAATIMTFKSAHRSSKVYFSFLKPRAVWLKVHFHALNQLP